MKLSNLSILSLLLLSGCSSYMMSVSSLRKPTDQKYSSFIVYSSDPKLSADNLQYNEFATYVRRAMESKGYIFTDDFWSADLAVGISYGSEKPITRSYAFSLPLYGQTGGGTVNYRATAVGPGGVAVANGQATQAPTYGVVGSQSIAGQTTMYPVFLTIESVDLSDFRGTKEANVVWETSVMAATDDGDLRRAFPYMVAGASRYFDRDSKRIVRFKVNDLDSTLGKIRKESAHDR